MVIRLDDDELIRNDGSFVMNRTSYPEKTSIQHYQLRNLIACSGNRIIAHPYHNTLHFFDPITADDRIVLENLPFSPTSLDTGYGYVAMAGPRGMTLIHDLSNGWSSGVFSTGPSMNNSIVLAKHGENNVHAIVCNNNHTISIYTLPSMHKLATIDMPSAINHTAVSPNGALMLAVSDEGNVHIYEIELSGKYRLRDTFRVSEEPCLSCAWHLSSEMFAVTSQDGYVCVYRLSGERLCKLESSETRKTRRAARSVQFSRGPLDLLVYAEHVSQINIIDTRTFKTRQVLRVAPPDADLHITGLCFSQDNRYLIVGLEHCLIELKLDDSARRRFSVGRINNMI